MLWEHFRNDSEVLGRFGSFKGCQIVGGSHQEVLQVLCKIYGDSLNHTVEQNVHFLHLFRLYFSFIYLFGNRNL